MIARRVLGTFAGVVAWLWLRSLRVEVEVDPALTSDESDAPWVLGFFHGKLAPLLAWPRRRSTAVLVSESSDGELLARVLWLLGLRPVRGSSSRGGARGLASLVRVLRRGSADAAFAVDGPRGPAGAAKPGAVLAARLAHGRLVPMGAAVSHGRVLEGSWDRAVLPRPFSRVAIVLGAPVDVRPRRRRVTSTDELTMALSTHIARAERRAEAILAARGSRVVRFASFFW